MSVTDGQLFYQNYRKTTGAPYSGVRVFHYVAGGTTTTKDVFSDGAMLSTSLQPFVGDTNGWVKFYGDGDYRLLVKSSVADGDLTLDDLDPIKLNVKAATLRPENQGASYPTATAANRGQIAAKTASGNVVELGVNKDGSGFAAIQLQGDVYTTTVQWAKGADLASASTLTLGSDGNFWDVTGTTQINAISSKPAGTWIRLRFISAGVQVTNNVTSLRLRNGRNYSSSAGDVLDFVSLGGGNWQEAMGRQNAVGAVLPFENCFLVATVGTNALTVSLKTEAGNDPTTADPARISFQNNPITTGGYDTVEVVNALSIALSAGSTMGFAANQSSRIYIGALRNGTVGELFLYHAVSGTTLKRLDETALYTTVAEGGTGGADLAQTLYSTTARTTVAIRVLGYVDITTGGTAGNWTSNPTAIRLLGPGVMRTGDVIQHVATTDTSIATGATIIPQDDTIPQITEGDQFMSLIVTPTNAINILRITHRGVYSTSSAGQWALALFQDATSSALTAISHGMAVGGTPQRVGIDYEMRAGTAIATTFRIRAGAVGGQTTSFNGALSVRLFGGTMNSSLVIEEIIA